MVPDILPYKYTKLMYNAAISPLAAAAGLDNGQLLRLPRVRQLFFDLLRENYAILRGAGVPLGKVGPLHPHTVARILAVPLLANSLAWAFYPTLRKTYCSMAGDLPKGRTEVDYYNGHLIELAGGALPARTAACTIWYGTWSSSAKCRCLSDWPASVEPRASRERWPST